MFYKGGIPQIQLRTRLRKERSCIPPKPIVCKVYPFQGVSRSQEQNGCASPLQISHKAASSTITERLASRACRDAAYRVIRGTSYFAITSIYLPFFLPRTVPAFLAPGGPANKSSVLLALLRVDAGRTGGAKPTLSPLTFDGGCGGAPGSEGGLDEGVPTLEGGPEGGPENAGPEPEVGGRAILASPEPLDAREGGPDGGPIAELATRLAGPLGGGGVGAADVVASGPAFLLTHFLRFSS
jgi:hypothetical protein